MNLVPVDDPADPRLVAYRDIRERDLRRRDGLFVCEGTVVLDALSRSEAFEPVSIIVLRGRLDGVRHILARFPASVPVHVVERDVLDPVVGFPMHRGVLAMARRRTPLGFHDLFGAPARSFVAAIELANHDNAGAILRIASAFGAGGVAFDGRSVDPLYRKSIRVSAGSALTLPWAHGGEAGAILDAMEAAGIAPLALSPGGERSLADIEPTGRVGLVLGAEGRGLPEPILSRCTSVRIPMAPGHDSLNVAVSCAVALYELTRRPSPKPGAADAPV